MKHMNHQLPSSLLGTMSNPPMNRNNSINGSECLPLSPLSELEGLATWFNNSISNINHNNKVLHHTESDADSNKVSSSSSSHQNQSIALVDILEREFCDMKAHNNLHGTAAKIKSNRDILDPRIWMDLEPTPIRESHVVKASTTDVLDHDKPLQKLVEECNAIFLQNQKHMMTPINNSNDTSSTSTSTSNNNHNIHNARTLSQQHGFLKFPVSALTSATTSYAPLHDGSNESSSSCSASTTDENESDITTPGHWDVVCSRGREFHKHPGCIRYRQLIQQYKDEYRNSTRRVDKAVVIEMLVDQVRELDGNHATPAPRFLKYNRKTQTFQAMDEKIIRDKVGHALRAN